MKTIIVKTQSELDALPKSFEEYTRIEIHGGTRYERIIVRLARENSSVVARENSSVVARENSSVVARDNSSIVALENSSIEAWDNSSIEAWGNSSIEARDNSSIEARDNSSIEAWGNSSIVAWGNSRVKAWGNSSVELFIAAYCIVLSSRAVIKKALDYSTVVFRGVKPVVQEQAETAFIREIPDEINPSFEEWLRRGYVHADGITKKLKSQKKLGEIEVFEVYEFPKSKTSFVVKRGETFSHGETIEKAIADLRFKISYRDTSDFDHWKNNIKQVVSVDEAIQAYRVITGACEMGTKQFVEFLGALPEKMSIEDILIKTQNQFGHESFKKFLGV